MAPPRRYALPNEQLVEELTYCRGVLGLSFDEAWERAVRPGRAIILTNCKTPPDGAVRWPTDSSDRIAWREAILSSRDEFRRAYERRPATSRELAVTILVDVLLDAADRREEAQTRNGSVASLDRGMHRRRGFAPPGSVRSVA